MPSPRLGGAAGLISIAEAEVWCGIPDLDLCFQNWLVEKWGIDLVTRKVGLGSQTVRIKVYNSVSYWYQPFQHPEEVVKQILRFAKTGKNSGKATAHMIWVRQFNDTDRDSFQGRKHVSYCSISDTNHR
jgi:hypothetical protein